jgi:hypothetical protein
MPTHKRQLGTQVTADRATHTLAGVYGLWQPLGKVTPQPPGTLLFGGNGAAHSKPNVIGGLAAQQSEETRSAPWDCDDGVADPLGNSTCVLRDQISTMGLRLLDDAEELAAGVGAEETRSARWDCFGNERE